MYFLFKLRATSLFVIKPLKVLIPLLLIKLLFFINFLNPKLAISLIYGKVLFDSDTLAVFPTIPGIFVTA